MKCNPPIINILPAFFILTLPAQFDAFKDVPAEILSQSLQTTDLIDPANRP